MIETRAYDDLNRLTSLENKQGETILSSYSYELNDAGHRLSVTEYDGRTVSYTYDELYRLTEENINGGERILAYTYDSVGNRLTKDDSLVGLTTYTYDANDRLLSEVLTQAGVTIHTITYTYDDNGNLLSRTQVTDTASETTTYTWNDDDRLVAVATPDGSSVTYEYDEEGIRVSSTVDGVTTDYLVDKNRPYAQVLEELNSEQLQAFYVYGHDLISQTRNAEQDFYQVDGLGSTRALTDENGNVTDTYDYEAFGELIESSGESENSYQFAGEQFDEELGDYYLRDRFYDPDLGRFIRRDNYAGTIADPLTLHKYVYANGNPVNGTDPSGFTTATEISSTFSIFNQLVARAFTTVLNPVALDLAKAWAIIIGVAAVSLLVLEKTDKKGETNISIAPNPDLDPDESEEDPRKAPFDERKPYQMRLQLQNAAGKTFGIPIYNTPEVGVTVSQVGEAALALWSYRRTLAKWFPVEHDTALIKGLSGVTKTAKSLPPFGVFQGNSQVYSRQWNKNDPKGNKSVNRGYYRVDFENLRGHNLRNF